MATFTKTYNVTPTTAQRAALQRALTTNISYQLNELKNSVEVVTSSVEGFSGIFVKMLINGILSKELQIGRNGGINQVIEY